MTYRRRTTGQADNLVVDERSPVPTVARWTGFEAKMLRAALRLTVNDFAAALGICPRTVNKWESRQEGITPLPEMQAVLDTTLRHAPEDACRRFFHAVWGESASTKAERAIAPVDPAVCARTSTRATANGVIDGVGCPGTVDFRLRSHDAAKAIVELTGSDMATRREFLELSLLTGTSLVTPVLHWAATVSPAAARPRQLGTVEIDDLERAVAMFQAWDASGVGGLHRKAVVGQLNAVAEALHEQRSPDTQGRLFHVAAELAQLAGWMTFDAGLCGPAQRYFLYALDACGQTGAVDLAAKIIGDMAQVSNSRKQYGDSLTMVRTALGSLSRGANPLVRSELHGHEAVTYARLGPAEVTQACRSVDRSIEEFERATLEARQRWNQYMDRAEVECLAGGAFIRLALESSKPNKAQEYARRAEEHVLNAIGSRGEQFSRSRFLDEIRLSKVRVAQREPAEAADIAHRALGRARGMRSSLVVSRLVDVHGLLVPRYRDVTAVADFREELLGYLRDVAPGRERDLVV